MIGQDKFISKIDQLIETDKFPRFSAIVGPRGSGKHLLAKHIVDKLGFFCYECDNGAARIKEMIDNVTKISIPTVCVLFDIDDISFAAKSALLKFTEEPPRNVYIIVTVREVTNLASTALASRRQIFRTDNYAPFEIEQFAKSLREYSEEELAIIRYLCYTPGDVEVLGNDVLSLYQFAEKVVDNIAYVSGANSFKIAERIAFNKDDEGFDLLLFWRAFVIICTNRLRDDPFRYSNGIRATVPYVNDMRYAGIRLSSSFDMWILDIRKLWR